MKKVVISIINFNGTKNTIDCLNSLEAVKLEGVEVTVVIVDNNSSSKFYVEKNFSKFKFHVIQNTKNSGFGGGHNIGIKFAIDQKADYVVILNNDTTVHENLITELVKTFDERKNIGVAGPKIYFSKGYEFHKERYKKEDLGKVIWYAGGMMDWDNCIGKHRGVDEVDKGQYDIIENTDFVSGCCMIIPLDVLKKVGGFDEKYFLYYEDSDLNMRIKKTGLSLLYNPHGVLWHKNAGSTGSGSELQDYYITRNRMLFGVRYAPHHSKLALIKESFFLLKNGRKWQKKGLMDYYLSRYGKGSFPV